MLTTYTNLLLQQTVSLGRSRLLALVPLVALLLTCLPVASLRAQGTAAVDKANQAALLEQYNKAAQPLLFMENRGQFTDQKGNLRKDVLFMARSKGFKVAVKGNGLSYQFDKTSGVVDITDRKKMNLAAADTDKPDEATETETYRVDMQLVGANLNPKVERLVKNPYTESYYNLPHAPEGIVGVQAYEKIIVKEVYPGIDWVIYTQGGGMKYDFIVHPGADPTQIKMKYAGAQSMALQADGSLKVITPLGELQEEAPLTFSGKKEVASRFELKDGVLSFSVPNYDPTQTLTIDPTLIWGTYYGGSVYDQGYGIDVDNLGNVYMTGITTSTGSIATVGSHDETYGGGSGDVFLVKFNTSGVRQWATYYGGTGYDDNEAVAFDGLGNVYLAGYTNSTTGIATGGAYQSAIGGGNDGFLVKFNDSGVRQWAT